MAILEAWAIEYQHQVIWQNDLLLDFVIWHKNQMIVIEVNGYWHKRKRAGRDARLSANWHGPLLWLDAENVSAQEIRDFLEKKAGMVIQ